MSANIFITEISLPWLPRFFLVFVFVFFFFFSFFLFNPDEEKQEERGEAVGAARGGQREREVIGFDAQSTMTEREREVGVYRHYYTSELHLRAHGPLD